MWMRGPESTFGHHIRWSSGNNSLSSFMLAGIGWHHCRTRNAIGPCNWSTVMWPAHVTGAPSCDLLPLAGDAECHQLYIPPGHGTWGLLSFVVGSLLLSTRSCRWAHLPVLAVWYTSGSSPYWEGPPVERARSTTFHSVYCLGVSPTSPRGLERPVMCDTHVPCTENL